MNRNPWKAFKLFKLASTSNKGRGQFTFGLAMLLQGYCYENGIGIERNVKESFRLYKEASKLNDPFSFVQVGRCFEYGIGVRKDFLQSARNYEMGHNQGDLSAHSLIHKLRIKQQQESDNESDGDSDFSI